MKVVNRKKSQLKNKVFLLLEDTFLWVSIVTHFVIAI